MYRHLRSAHESSEYRCTTCSMQFKRKDYFKRHMKRQHPITHGAITGAENHSPLDGNDIEMSTEPQENNQTEGGPATNETSDCITEDEAINGNLNVYNFPAHYKTKFDPLQFLHSNYDKTMTILRAVLLKRQNVKWYLTMQVRFKKEKEDMTEMVEPYFHGRCHIAFKVED